MYKKSQVKYLNLPKIPELLKYICIEELSKGPTKMHMLQNYKWTKASYSRLETWLEDNIAPDLIWGIQVIDGNLAKHQDTPTTVKITYIFDEGGSDVFTYFYNNKNEIIEKIKIEPFRWHIINVNVPHSVSGVEDGKRRISLTGRIFEKI